MRYAEDANYWDTTVHPAKSQGDIIELLEDFGANQILVAQGQVAGKYAWMIRFIWQEKSYRFTFTPLPCRNPQKIYSYSGKKRTSEEQSRFQMGRIASYFVKAILTAAEAHPHALFGFLELPDVKRNGLPITAGELDITGLAETLPALLPKNLPLEEEEDIHEGEYKDMDKE